MKEFIKTTSKNNKNLIDGYKENDFAEILESQDDKDGYLEKAYIYLYFQINKTILSLEDNDNDIATTSNLLSQLNELKILFFKFLQKKYHSNSWLNLVDYMKDYGGDFKYISSSMFTEKHIDLIIQRLYKKNDLVSNLPLPKKNNQERIHFEVAVEFANGRIYDLVKEKKSEVQISEIIFNERKFKPSSYRTYINNSLSHRPSELRQSIFKRKNAEKELNEVIKYCISKKTIIAQNFIEDCKKHNIVLEVIKTELN